MAQGGADFYDRRANAGHQTLRFPTAQPDISHGDQRGILAGFGLSQTSWRGKDSGVMTSSPLVKTSRVSRSASVTARAIVEYRDSRWFTTARVILISSLVLAPLAFGAVQPWSWAVLALVAIMMMLCWAMG